MLNCFLNIHFILCTDGTAAFTYKNVSLWPIYLMIADLPIHIRQKSESMILYALATNKPNWNECFIRLRNFLNTSHFFSVVTNYGNCSCNAGNRVIILQNVNVNAKFEVIYVVCDLPGLCSVTNCTQYNGKFGCPKCYHPGRQVNSRRIYPFKSNCYLRTDDEHLLNERAAFVSRSSVFGVKGPSFLQHIIHIPSAVVIDPMHFLFLGVTKQYLKLMFDCHYSYFPMYMGRPSFHTH